MLLLFRLRTEQFSTFRRTQPIFFMILFIAFAVREGEISIARLYRKMRNF